MKNTLTMKDTPANSLDRVRQRTIDMLLSCRKSGADGHPSETPDSLPLGHGGLEISSLLLLQVFVKAEEAFGFTFDDAAVASANFRTVGDFVNFVMQAYDARTTVG